MHDWDDAFANMKHVEGSDALPGFWAARAAKYRQGAATITEDLPYGTAPREKFDLVLPEGPAKGLVVFVHGGFWMRLDKSYWTDLAEGARQNGWAVALPSYTLTPQNRIAAITAQVGAAITAAAAKVAGPIRLMGHSAGGHLVSRMICADTPLDRDTSARIARVLSISGLHDLRPLMRTEMNDTLHLDLAEARAESPALAEPLPGVDLTAWVGGGERPEFLRQTALIETAWRGFDVRVQAVVDGHHNHFTVLEGLKEPHSPLTRALLA